MATDRLGAALRGAVGLDSRSRKARLHTAATIVLAAWQQEARGAFRSLRRAYLGSLTLGELTDTRATVELAGEGAEGKAAQLARMGEFGMGPGGVGTVGRYDIRTFALKQGTRSLRWGRQGPYLNVPFDRKPVEIKRMGGAAALRQARNLAATTSLPAEGGGARTRWGGRLPAGLAPKLREHHVADPLQGLVRLASSYSQGADGAARVQTTGYRLWRRMSWAGQPWWHPGIAARRLGERVGAKVPELIREVF